MVSMKRIVMGLGIVGSFVSAACSSTPAPVPDPIFPPGERHTYVVSSVVIPTSSREARDDGLDLTGDGAVDNQLGMVFGTLAAYGIDINTSVTASINRGTSTTLAELQTANFADADTAAFTTYIGGASIPPACIDATDTTCRQQFSGSAAFQLATATEEHPLLGSIADGTFAGGPRPLALQLALSADTPVVITLIGAHVQLSDLSVDGIGHAIIAGGMTTSDVDTKFLPAASTQMNVAIAAQCTNVPSGHDCGCPKDSPGSEFVTEFDSNFDCTISTAELLNNGLVGSLTAPDVFFDTDGNPVDANDDGAIPALSVGLAAILVGANFTPPVS